MKGYRSKRPGNCAPSMVNFSDSVTVRIYWVSLILQVTPGHFSLGCHRLIPNLHKMNLWTLHFRKGGTCLSLSSGRAGSIPHLLSESPIRSSSSPLGVSVHAVWKYGVVWKAEAWSLSPLIFPHLLLLFHEGTLLTMCPCVWNLLSLSGMFLCPDCLFSS